MSSKGERLSLIVFSSALALGTAACGPEESKSLSDEELSVKIDQLKTELNTAVVTLANGQTEYEKYVESVPEECAEVIQPFLRPNGRLVGELTVAEVTKTITPWCAPTHIDAVVAINDMYTGLESSQKKVDDLTWWLGASVAAAGVSPPTTIG